MGGSLQQIGFSMFYFFLELPALLDTKQNSDTRRYAWLTKRFELLTNDRWRIGYHMATRIFITLYTSIYCKLYSRAVQTPATKRYN